MYINEPEIRVKSKKPKLFSWSEWLGLIVFFGGLGHIAWKIGAHVSVIW